MNQDNNNNNNNSSSSSNNNNNNNNSSSMNDDANVNAEKYGSSSHMNDDNGLNELSNMNIDSTSCSKKKKNCLYCLQEVEGSSRCSKCRTALYCSRACQEKHWPVHKNNCINSNDAENSDQKLYMKAMNHSKQGNFIYTNTMHY